MSSTANPHQPPLSKIDSGESPAPSMWRLILFTLILTCGFSLLLFDRMFLLAVGLVVMSGPVLMTKDQWAAARKRYTEPLNGRDIVKHIAALLLLCGIWGFLGSSGFGTGVTGTFQFKIGVKTLFAIAWLVILCPPWWRWYIQATIPQNTKEL